MKYLKTARNKYIIIKKILELDNKYTSDYLMRWRKQDLIDYYNNLMRKKEKENAEDKRWSSGEGAR